MGKIFNQKNLPPMSFAPSVLDTGGSKKIETVLMEYSGAGVKLIHEKPEAKNLVTLSL